MFNKLSHDARTVVVSVIAASVVAGPSAAAAAYVANADKVDNKHAVGAGATVTARKGKLVATSAKTGRLPNNIIAKARNADKLDRLDSSAFLRGVRMRTGPAFTVARNNFTTGSANCLPGEQATGGGVYPNNNVYYPRLVASFPLPNADSFGTPGDDVTPTGWRVWVANNDQASAAPDNVQMTPYVLCIGANP